jgi:hypothetical protein
MGIVLDSINAMAAPLESLTTHHVVWHWFKLIRDLPLEPLPNQSRLEVLWRTLLVNLDLNNLSSAETERLATSFRSFILFETTHAFISSQKRNETPTSFWESNYFTALTALPETADWITKEEIVEMVGPLTDITRAAWPEEIAPMEEYRRALWTASSYRRLVRTHRGCLVLAPNQSQSGDVIAFLQGGRVPYVFRKNEDSNMFELVGDCYVHGFMNGEIEQWGPPVFREILFA